MYFIGIDIGTQGSRVIVADEYGSIVTKEISKIKGRINIANSDIFFEQNPESWWECTRNSLGRAIYDFKSKGLNIKDIISISVDGTSGTILPLGKNNRIIRNAIMYKDQRADSQSEKINKAGAETINKLGYKIKPSFGLSKILWIKENEPGIYRESKYFIHQSDFIVGKLTGIFRISDHSNALKTGFDLKEYIWPDYIEKKLKIDINKLPEIIKPGEIISTISSEISKEIGLHKDTFIVAGMTDSTASLFSSGVCRVGEFNTTIGTTLAIKGITKDLIKDILGRVYCHLHPEGFWLPGGASSTGGECIESKFLGKDFKILDKEIESMDVTGLIAYPLIGVGERFPFISKDAKGFIIGKPRNKYQLYKGYLEGVGFVERLCYEVLSNLGAKIKDRIFITGGGAKSNVWSKIRASVMNKKLLKPRVEDTAMGATIVAASKVFYKDIIQASKKMVKISKTFYPEEIMVAKYSEVYNKFKKELNKRGYI